MAGHSQHNFSSISVHALVMGFRLSLVFILSACVLCVVARSSIFDPPGGRMHATTLYHSVDQQAFDSKLSRAQEQVGNMIVETYTASGIPLLCEMPVISFGEAEEDGFIAQPSHATVASFLLHLKSQCMRHLDGWWTYEFCYGKQLRQFHLSQEGKLDEYFLGRAVDPNLGVELLHEMETNDAELLRRMESLTVDHGEQAFYSEKYAFGTPCEIEDRAQRQVEVRWFCASGASVSSIRGLKEPASCQYILEIDTPLLCQHPAYRSAETPLHTVACYFVDTEPSMPTTEAPKPPTPIATARTASSEVSFSDVPSSSQSPPQTTSQTQNNVQHGNIQQDSRTAPSNAVESAPIIDDTPELKITLMSPLAAPKGGDKEWNEPTLADGDALGAQMSAVLRSSIKQRAAGKVQLALTRPESEIIEDPDDEDFDILSGEALEALLSSLSDSELLVLLGTIDDALHSRTTDEDGMPVEDEDDFPIVIEIDTIPSMDGDWAGQEEEKKKKSPHTTNRQ